MSAAQVSQQPFFRAKSEINAVACAHDGSRVLCASGGIKMSKGGPPYQYAGEDCCVRVWDSKRTPEKLLHTLGGHAKPVVAARFSSDGSIVSLSWDGDLRIWDADGSQRLALQTDSSTRSSALALFPSRHLIVVGRWDGKIQGWDSKSGKERFTLQAAWTGEVRSLAASPDEELVLSGHYRKVGLWNIAKPKEVRRFDTEPVHGVAWHPDGKRFACTISPDGASAGSAKPCVLFWEASSGKELARFGIVPRGPHCRPACCAFSPNGKLLAAAGGLGKPARATCAIYLWDVETTREIARWEGHTQVVGSLAFAPNGRTLWSASADKTMRRWDMPKR